MRIIVEPGVALNYLKSSLSEIEIGPLAMTADIYIMSLKTFVQQWPRVYDMLEKGGCAIIEKTDESVITQWHVATSLHYVTKMQTGQIRWITGGDTPSSIMNLNSDTFDRASLHNDFKKFHKQYDQRRGTDFVKTFPEMTTWWLECEYHARQS